MKISRNKIIYFSILLILFLTYYTTSIYMVLENRSISRILLLVFTFLLICINSKKIFISKNYLCYFFLICCTFFLRKYYLSFYIILISWFINKKTRLKQLLYIMIFFYVLTLMLNSFGCLESSIFEEVRKFAKFKIFRHSLGFPHPNTAMSLLLPIFLLFYYVYYDNYKKIVIFFTFIFSVFFFFLTFSRTTFLLIILFIGLIFIKKELIKKFRIIFYLEGLILVFSSILLPKFLKNTIIDQAFSRRFYLFDYYLINFKPKYLNNIIIDKDYRIYPLDNVYLRILFENGKIGLLLILLLTIVTMIILFKQKDYKAIKIFSIILIFGLMEATALHYYFNVIYFIITDYIFNKEIFYDKK